MRIAIVTTSWPESLHDPAGHFVRAEAKALEREGHEIVLVAPEPRGERSAFGWPGVASRVRERPFRLFDAARWTAEARRRAKRMRVDRLVAHWAVPCAWPIGIAVGDAAVDVVSHGGDVRLLSAMPRSVRMRIVRAVTERAERWRFVSGGLLEDLAQELDRATRARVEGIAMVLPAAIEMPDVAERVAGLRRELQGLRVAVSVGRLVASKRVDAAIEHVARARDVDTLVVIGDGPEREALAGLAQRRKVDARFLGKVGRDDALAWIGAATVVIHASENEGLSTVVREAEALGTPVLFLR